MHAACLDSNYSDGGQLNAKVKNVQYVYKLNKEARMAVPTSTQTWVGLIEISQVQRLSQPFCQVIVVEINEVSASATAI